MATLKFQDDGSVWWDRRNPYAPFRNGDYRVDYWDRVGLDEITGWVVHVDDPRCELGNPLSVHDDLLSALDAAADDCNLLYLKGLQCPPVHRFAQFDSDNVWELFKAA